jgi:hypothetical protein
MSMPLQQAKIQMSEPIGAQTVAITNPLGVQSVYANDFGLGFTLTDARLIFAELGNDLESSKPTKIVKANVVIPIQALEAIARAMLAALEQFQKLQEKLQATQAAAQQNAKQA